MKKIIFPFIFFLVAGCSQSIIFSRDNLPSATVGELYYVKVNISGGTSAVRSIYAIVTPSVLSVQGIQKDGWTDYNNLTIKGIPEALGNITVKITGETAPTLFNTEPTFEKIYIIKVKEAKK
ncbi:hypothetical protein RHO12_01370 [Orbus sturtevantii]|uniref:hypothetical protein n=1 Tax=Orbus sturtevantii TaxID=3074109 RepID=UPI00370D3A82